MRPCTAFKLWASFLKIQTTQSESRKKADMILISFHLSWWLLLNLSSLRCRAFSTVRRRFLSCFTTKPLRKSSPCLFVGVEFSNFAVCKTAVSFSLIRQLKNRKVHMRRVRFNMQAMRLTAIKH